MTLKNKKDSEINSLNEQLHNQACEEGRDWYNDPVSGFMVFTKLYHLKRGHCCESGCRHCPYKVEPDQSSHKDD